MVTVLGVPERQLLVHFVAVPAAVAGFAQVAGQLEIVDDMRCGSLRDADRPGDVPEAGGWLCSDHLEHMGVVCYEPEKMILLTGT